MPPEDRDTEAELEEEGYVREDRRASRTGPADGSPEAEPTPEEPTADAPPPDGVPDIHVYSLLRMSVGMYVEQAWIHMGVRMDPRKNRVESNLPYAKVAIDTAAFMIEQLQPDLDETEKRELDVLLANLRMNYVQRV